MSVLAASSGAGARPAHLRAGRGHGGPRLQRLSVLLAVGLLVVQALPYVGSAAAVAAAGPSLAYSVDAGLSGSTYTGFNTSATFPNPQDLTGSGGADWRLWGRTGTSLEGDDRRSGGAGISGLTAIDPGTPIALRALGTLGLGVGVGPSVEPFSFSWSDGTTAPTASAVRAGLQHNNSTSSLVPGYGFSFTVPTSTDEQQLRVWVSAHHGGGRLHAAIGGVTIDDTSIAGGQNRGGVYTLTFTGSGAIGETLSVAFTMDTPANPSTLDSDGFASTEANVVVYAAALKALQARAATPVLVRAATGAAGGILGRVGGATPSSTEDITLYTATSCDPVVTGQTITTITVDTDATGAAVFALDIPNLPATGFVTASGKDATHSTSAYASCVPLGPDNDSWPKALDISTTGGNASSHTPLGYTIDQAGQSRWFKFHVTPGAQLQVDLTGLPADYDVALYGDIAKAYTSLSSPSDVTKLSANFSAQAFSPQAFSAQAFSPQAFSAQAFSPQAFSAQAFSADVFSAQAFSAQAFSGQAFSGQAFSPQAFSAQAFSGQAFSGQAFSPQAFSAQAFSPQAFSAAQMQSIVAISANPDLNAERVRNNTWNNDGDFYIRVVGKNGASDLAHPFALGVTETGTTCANVHPMGSAPAASPTQGIKTVILLDSGRISTTAAAGSPEATAEKASLRQALDSLAAQPEVAGDVVDVAGDQRLADLNAQADANPGCPYAKNLVASALKDIVDSYRTPLNPGLAYVTIVGGDAAIPFFRHPDEALLAPESNFAGVGVNDASASKASLELDYVLSQDEYGSTVQVAQNANSFPVPGLAVGRLVETAAEASGVIAAYPTQTGGTVATPASSLVTGYDFLSDAASAIGADLASAIGGTANTQLIAPNNISHTDPASWTADDLRTALLGSRHDIVFLAGHFNATSALAADFATSMSTADLLASTTDFTNSIVFSAGCHSGYNLVDPDALRGVDPLDWAQAFARKHATLIAGTGYQYGDTDFVMYSERLYAELAHQLRTGNGPVSVGQALVRAKQAYLAATPSLGGIDRKALLEATVFGLPMLSVQVPNQLAAPGDSSAVTASPVTSGPGADLGLQSASLDLDLSDTSPDRLTKHTKDLGAFDGTGAPVAGPTATWYSGPDGVTSKPFEPALPLLDRNVTVTGQTLRGIGFLGGTFTDHSPIIPLTGAATEDIRGVHAAFDVPTFYPMRTAQANYYDALNGGATRLLVTPAQHRGNGNLTSTLRLYSSMQFRLYYSSNVEKRTVGGVELQPGLAAAPSIQDLGGVESTAGHIAFDTHVTGDPSAGIQAVWVTYTGWDNQWRSLFLAQDPVDSSHWSGTLAVPAGKSAADLLFMEQAANGVGLVAMADSYGAYYGVVPFARDSQAITFASISDATATDADFTISPTSTAGLPVSIVASGPCTLSQGSSPATVHITGSGKCTITASQAGDATHRAAPNVAQSFDIAKVDQSITFPALPPTATFGDAAVPLGATASSGLPVTYTSSGSCSIVGPDHDRLSFDGAGTCTVTANQAGSNVYNAAGASSQTIGVAQAARTISIANLPASGQVFGTFTPTYATAGGGTASTTSSTLAVCSVSGTGTVTFLATGTCTLVAAVTADANYLAATGAPQSVSVSRAAQAITFTTSAPAAAVYGDSYTPAATSTSGLPVVIAASGACTLASGKVTMTVSGTCTITANQAGNASYLGAPQVTQAFTVGRRPASLAFTGTPSWSSGAGTTASVTLTGTVTPAPGGSVAVANATVDFLLFRASNFTGTPDDHCAATVSAAGVATCVRTLGLDNWTVVMTIPAGNAYFTAPSASPAVVAVIQTANKSVSGAGSVVDPSTGNIPVKVSTTATRGVFGFAVNYRTGTTTPQGVAAYTFRGTNGYDYWFTASSWTGGSLSISAGKASFTSKCTVTAINPATLRPVAGIGGTGYTCKWDLTDGSPDKLALSVTTSAGALYHQVGTPAGQVTLASGGLLVRN